jgi:phosphotransferase system IIA component
MSEINTLRREGTKWSRHVHGGKETESGYNILNFEPDTISEKNNNKVRCSDIPELAKLAVVIFWTSLLPFVTSASESRKRR